MCGLRRYVPCGATDVITYTGVVYLPKLMEYFVSPSVSVHIIIVSGVLQVISGPSRLISRAILLFNVRR